VDGIEVISEVADKIYLDGGAVGTSLAVEMGTH
jgi:hypothetical protein